MTPPRRGNPSGGEQVDRAVADSVRLAHLALERFPDLVRRHKFIAGGAAISSSLIVLAGVAIARRMLAGETPEEAVAAVTEDEVQGMRPPEPEADEEPAAESEEVSAEPTPIGANVRPAGFPLNGQQGQAAAAVNGAMRPPSLS